MAETKEAGAPSCPKCGGKDWTYTQGDDRLRCPECEPSSRLDADAKIGAKAPSPRPLTDAELVALAIMATLGPGGHSRGCECEDRVIAELERRGVLGPAHG